MTEPARSREFRETVAIDRQYPFPEWVGDVPFGNPGCMWRQPGAVCGFTRGEPAECVPTGVCRPACRMLVQLGRKVVTAYRNAKDRDVDHLVHLAAGDIVDAIETIDLLLPEGT